ncbi:MAG: DoxX family protein, partial [Acidimicrobiia bacterium]
MASLFLIGRILFGGYFLYNGVNHFINHGMLAQYAASKGVPAPDLAVTFSGLLLLVGGASILLGVWPRIGAFLIIVFLLGVTPMMHNFWAVSDPTARMSDMINFTKNMALLGAALSLMIIPEPWPLSLGA